MEIGFIQQIIYTIDIERYQRVLEHALSKVDFSVCTGIYMLPSNLNLNIGRTKGHNNKTLVSNADIKIRSNRDINRDHKKLAPLDAPNAVIPAVLHDPVGTLLHHYTFNCTDWFNCLAFLVVNKWHHYYSQSVVLC